MRKYVIAFNGPPSCGKDRSAELAQRYLQTLGFRAIHFKFAGVLKRSVHYFMNVKYSTKEVEQLKSQPVELGQLGKTLRDAYIAFSEDFAKPIYGQEIFGRLVARDIERDHSIEADDKATVYLISDAGFGPEQEPVIDFIGDREYALFQVIRPGHTFRGDSRSYIRPHRGMFGTINNNGDLQWLAEELKTNIDRIIKAGGWYA